MPLPKSSAVSRSALAILLGLATPWVLAEPFEARLVAEQDCPATPSIKRPDNPGKVRLRPGDVYRVIGRNESQPTHYQLRIESIQPTDRWVAVECGKLVPVEPATAADHQPGALAPTVSEPQPRTLARDARGGPSMAGQLVLAASWQPAFCERRHRKPECRTQTPDRADARQFSLHGLWPQPIGNSFCGVSQRERRIAESGDWRDLPDLDLDGDTRAALEVRMPGVVSGLPRYEWTKHGTCYGTDADTYFDDAMALLDQLNASAVQRLFEDNIGRRLRAGEVRDAFDRAFGADSGERVRLECDDGGLITELRIGIKGKIERDSDLGALIQAAPTRTVGCRGGWVDRAGRGR